MPSALMLTEDALPKYEERESDEQRIKDIYSYLFMLVEQLRYSLGNLGGDNFNATALDELGKDITKDVKKDVQLISYALVGETGSLSQLVVSGDALIYRVENAEKKAEAALTAEGLKFKVTNGETFSSLELYSGKTLITSADIAITGMVTFFDLSQKGKTVINGSNITTGTITAIDITSCYMYSAEIYGAEIHGSNMTMYFDSDYYDNCKLYYVWGSRDVGSLGFYYDSNVSDDPFLMLSTEFGMDLWIGSARDLYIEARDTYFTGDSITISADTVYVDNPVLYDATIVDGNNGEWTFSKNGISRNGTLHFPI